MSLWRQTNRSVPNRDTMYSSYDTPASKRSKGVSEEELIASIDDVMSKSAAVAESLGEPTPALVDEERFEDRVEISNVEVDLEITEEVTEANWFSQPTVKDQIIRYPESVRMVDPETKVLSMSNPAHVAELNRIQKASADPIARTLAITEYERQTFEGSWTVFLTFCKVQYRKM